MTALNRMAAMRPCFVLLLLSAASLVFSGCSNLGPGLVKAGRNDYNVSLQNTNDEQLLLNLVRLRYRDTPMFLEVSSVATQFVVNTGISANRSFVSGPDSTGLNGQIGYSEQPTVTYTPLQMEGALELGSVNGEGGGLLAVHSARERPAPAAVAVNYRGSWFYIDDADLDSKSTFSLLSQLFALQAGKAKGAAPVLTLPIGG